MSKEPTVLQLRSFRAVAEELHYGRAAKALRTSQPPLTRQIQALERTLGIQLFVRGPRHVELTAAGSTLYREVVASLERLGRGIELARQVAEGKAGRLVVAYLEPLGIDLLPRVLGSFRQLQPHVELRLMEMHSLDQVSALRDGAIDVALLRAPANADPSLTFEHVWMDELVAALPERHVLARQGVTEIRLGDLAADPFVVYEAGLGIGILTTTLTACSAAGFTPVVAQAAQSTPMLLSMVAASDGVALCSREVARVPRPGLKFLRLHGHDVRSEVLMGWRTGEEFPARDDLQHLIARTQRR